MTLGVLLMRVKVNAHLSRKVYLRVDSHTLVALDEDDWERDGGRGEGTVGKGDAAEGGGGGADCGKRDPKDIRWWEWGGRGLTKELKI